MALTDRDRAANQFRRGLMQREARTVRQLNARWQREARRLQRRLEATTAKIESAIANGKDPRITWRREAKRLERQIAIAAKRAESFAGTLYPILNRGVANAAAYGVDAAYSITSVAFGPDSRATIMQAFDPTLADDAFEQIVAQTTRGPVSDTMMQASQAMQRIASETLESAVLTSANPRTVLAELRRALDVPRWQAERLARTEMVNAHREAGRAWMIEHDDMIGMWQWHADISTCCGACLAMHGRRFTLDVPQTGHPNCRCGKTPVMRAELEQSNPLLQSIGFDSGLGEASSRAESMLQRNDLAQRFGHRKADLLKSGRIERADLLVETRTQRWGVNRTEASVEEALSNASRRTR